MNVSGIRKSRAHSPHSAYENDESPEDEILKFRPQSVSSGKRTGKWNNLISDEEETSAQITAIFGQKIEPQGTTKKIHRPKLRKLRLTDMDSLSQSHIPFF